jgi:hypothetical protein
MSIHGIVVMYTVKKYYENINKYMALNDTTTFDDVLAEARCEIDEKY